MSTDVLDDLSILQIELHAVTACTERSDFDPLLVPGEQMVDNDYRAGIRQAFDQCEDWQDWMVEPLLAEVKRHTAARDALMGFCSAFVGRMMQ